MTGTVIIVVTVLVLIWDAYLALDGKPGNTITQTVIAWSKRYPFVPFALGFLMGHFFG